MTDPAQPRLDGIVERRLLGTWPTVAHAFLEGQRNPNTRASYRVDLDQWATWCAARGIAPLGAMRADVETFVAELDEAGGAPATIKRKLCAIRGAYKRAVREDVTERNPALDVQGPRVDAESQQLGLSAGQVERFLAAAGGGTELALATLLAHNPLRVSEALGCDVADLTTVREHQILRTVAKGGKRREHPIGPATLAALERYLDGRRTGPMFLHPRTARRADRSWALRRWRAIAAAAGLPAGVTPHTMRHTWVTLALERGAKLEDVQDAAGHASPATTQRYNRARMRLEKYPTLDFGPPRSEPDRA